MRRALRYAGMALLGLVVLFGLVLVLLATPPGRSMLAGFIERTVSGDGLTLSIGSLSGWPPFAFGADGVVVADTQGTFAEVDGLAIDLNVGALFSGRIDLDSVTAERIAVLRQPVLLPAADTEGGGGLFPLAVDRLQIARLELGAGLVGQPAALAVAGNFALHSDGGIQAQLNADRIDGGAGTIAASVARADGSAPIALDVTLDEAADGILVGLLGRDVGPGYRLVAHTSLSDSGLTGAVSLTSDGAARFAGKVGLAAAGDAQRLVVNGEGDLGEFVPAGFADLLAGTIDVDVDLEWSRVAGASLPRIVIHDGQVSTGAVQASASGVLGGADTAMTLRVDAANPAGGPLSLPVGGDAPLRIDSLSLSGEIKPAESAHRLDLIGRIAGLAVNGIAIPGIGLSLAVEAEGDDPLADESLPFALRVEADAIDLGTTRLTATEAEPLLVTADGTLDVPATAARVDVDLSALGGRALFAGDVAPDEATGELRARFGDLAPIGALVGRDLSGALAATLNGRFFGAEGMRLAIEGTATDFDPGEPAIAPLLAGQTRFSLTFADDPTGRLSVEDLSVDGTAVTLAGNVSLDGSAIDGRFSGDIADLALVAEQSRGAATVTGEIAGSLDRPTFDATVAVADGELVGQPVADATVRVQGEPVDTGWRGMLTLGGSFAGRPLQGTAEAMVDIEAGRFAFPAVDLAIAENRITGAIEQAEGGLLSGSLSVEAPNLATLAALALVEATGSAEASIRFQPDDGRQAVDVVFNARDIAVATLVADKADGTVRIDDALGTPQIAGSIDAAGISAGSIRIDTAQATAEVDGPTTRFAVKASGPDIGLDGAGSLTTEAAGQTLEVSRLSGTAFGFPVEIDGPARVSLGDETRIGSVRLALGGGRVSITGPVTPALGLDVTIEGVSAAIANQFSPGLGARGTISGSARVTGITAAPVIAWQAELAGFAVAQTESAGLPGLAISASGEATTEATTIKARVTGAGATLQANGRVPFAGGDPAITVTGTAPLELVGLFTDRELDLGGTATLDLKVASATSISGSVALSNATIIDAETRFGVTDIGGRINLNGQTATINGVTGRLAQGGQITVGGSIEINPDAGLPANLTIGVQNGRYNDGTMVDAAFTAALTLTGPLMTTGTVGGRVDISRADILLPDRFGGGAALDVRHVNVAPGFVPPVRPAPPSTSGGGSASGGLNLNITVASTNRTAIIVRGFGLDASLGGSLTVTGDIGNPVTVGGFEMARGRIEVLGRRFEFTRGRLTFTGDLVPVLDFEASTRTSQVTAIVNVDGPADDPVITFTSNPQLPEEEIISQILFDRNVSGLTAFQAAQLVDAIGQFSGAFARGDGLFTRVRQMTGLDDLDVRQNESGGTTVGIGKRINDNIRLGVEQDTGGAGRVTIDLDITRNLKARGSAGDDGSGSVGLNYEYEY